MRSVTLKVNLPTGKGKQRMLRGQQIRVNDVDYARLVPRLAHDTIEYLAADKARKDAYNKANPEKVKLFRATHKARVDAAQVSIKAKADAAKVEAYAEKKRTADRLAKILKNEELARKAKKEHDAAVKKAADPGDGNR